MKYIFIFSFSNIYGKSGNMSVWLNDGSMISYEKLKKSICLQNTEILPKDLCLLNIIKLTLEEFDIFINN